MFGRAVWRLISGILFLYIAVHLAFNHFDLRWMPPYPDLSFVTDSPKKKKPDGPLVSTDGFLRPDEGVNKTEILPNSGVQFVDAVPKPKLRQRLKISEDFLNKFKNVAKRLHRSTTLPANFVLFTVINKAFVNVTMNLLCNLYALPPPPPPAKSKKWQKNVGNLALTRAVLVVALHEQSCAELRAKWHEPFSQFLVSCLALFSRGKNAKMDKDEQNAYNEPMKPNSPRHKQLMKVRANLMAVLSETKIPFVMFESDAIWLQNPMEFFAKQQTVLDDANIILSLNSIKGQQRLGANLIIAFANNGTRRLLQELRRQLNQDENLLDQEVIINQLCHSQFGGVLCRQFSLLDISDGIWLRLSDGERLARRWPLIVHNNFYTQIEDKMARQAINGFWFLSPKNSCNLSKAQRILEKYNKISQKSGG